MIRFLVAVTIACVLHAWSALARVIQRFPHPLHARRTSPFGWRWGRLHRGIDYGAVRGEPIVAPIDGVVLNGNEPNGAGLWVNVTAPGILYKSFHLQRHALPHGTRVRAGDIIGYSDSTGSSTGDHNHDEIWINGVPVDPEPYLEEARRAELGGEPSPPTTPQPEDVMSQQQVDAIVGHVTSEANRVLGDLGVWIGQTRDYVVNNTDDEANRITMTLNARVSSAGWASRPYLVGIHGEAAVYKHIQLPDNEYLVHVRNPALMVADPPDVELAKNLAWLEYTIESGYNPDIQWYYPEPTPDQVANGHANDPYIVAGLRLLPGYVPC